ncbi:MAG: GNAT family N-acetyltransferase [Phycisphaeraceae bacterium]|nr:GNAT family N-acetyltransferase [Phycisphaeraceae bacterium]
MNALEPKPIILKDGCAVTLRPPTGTDAQAMIEYLDLIRRQTPHIYMCPHDPLPTLEQEREYIRSCQEPDALCILGEVGGRIIAMASLRREARYKLRHVAVFGMTVMAEFRNQGLGRALLGEIIAFARAHPEILKLHMGVYPDNPPAMELYRKMGFIEEARLIRHLREPDGTFHDEVKMYLWVGQHEGSKA